MKSDEDKPLTPAEAREKFRQGLRDYLSGKDPGSIVFRLKRSRKAGETYPLKLTPLQRETLLNLTRLSRNLKNKLQQAGEGTQIVGLTWNELHKLSDEVDQASQNALSIDRKRLMAVSVRVNEFLNEGLDEVFGLEAPELRKRSPKSNLLFQFKITLLDVKPAIWRRIQVRDCTLTAFHEHLQAAFGWENYHLHEFKIGEVKYSQPAPDGSDDDLNFEDEAHVLLSDLLPKSASRTTWTYEYDFGDCWRHEILFEGFPPIDPRTKYPLCLEGERACPPEDCGGHPGYARYVNAMADPEHEEHEELLRWRGPFDPEAFDAKKATKEMRKETCS